MLSRLVFATLFFTSFGFGLLGPALKHDHPVESMQPTQVSTIVVGKAYLIDDGGIIRTCEDPAYGLYVRPFELGRNGSMTTSFFYVLPPAMLRSTNGTSFAAICLRVR